MLNLFTICMNSILTCDNFKIFPKNSDSNMIQLFWSQINWRFTISVVQAIVNKNYYGRSTVITTFWIWKYSLRLQFKIMSEFFFIRKIISFLEMSEISVNLWIELGGVLGVVISVRVLCFWERSERGRVANHNQNIILQPQAQNSNTHLWTLRQKIRHLQKN